MNYRAINRDGPWSIGVYRPFDSGQYREVYHCKDVGDENVVLPDYVDNIYWDCFKDVKTPIQSVTYTLETGTFVWFPKKHPNSGGNHNPFYSVRNCEDMKVLKVVCQGFIKRLILNLTNIWTLFPSVDHIIVDGSDDLCLKLVWPGAQMVKYVYSADDDRFYPNGHTPDNLLVTGTFGGIGVSYNSTSKVLAISESMNPAKVLPHPMYLEWINKYPEKYTQEQKNRCKDWYGRNWSSVLREGCFVIPCLREMMRAGVRITPRGFEEYFAWLEKHKNIAEYIEMTAALTAYRASMYDVDALEQQKEKEALNVILRPNSVAAQKQLWRWEYTSNPEIVRLKKYVGEPAEEIHVPGKIGKREVYDVHYRQNRTSVIFMSNTKNMNRVPDTAYTFFSKDVKQSLRRLYIDDGIQHLADYMLSDCSFDELHLPKSLEEIATGLFVGTTFTGQLVIPDSVTRIREAAFRDANGDGIKEIVIPENCVIESGAFEDSQIESLVTRGGLLTCIKMNAFVGSELKVARLNGPLVMHWIAALRLARKLESVYIYDAEEISNRAFQNTGLRELHVTGKLKHVEEDAFDFLHGGCLFPKLYISDGTDARYIRQIFSRAYKHATRRGPEEMIICYE